MVAEVAFDPDPIPNGVSTASSDKLAQRNLAIVQSANPGEPASHRIQHTLTIRPTRATLQRTEKPDELMIDWGATPVGSTATLYFPGIAVGDILAYAGRLYESSLLQRLDDHTLQTKTGGVTYVPIPPGAGPGLAGLLSVDLPATVRRGQVFKIVVRQVTTDQVRVTPPVPTVVRDIRANVARSPEARRLNFGRIAAAVREPTRSERRVLGTFQITVPVSTKETMLPLEQRKLSVLTSILARIPAENRWYLPFKRYVGEIRDRVHGLGGEAGEHEPGEHGPRHGERDFREREHREHERPSFTGKIDGLVYDRFGDFRGFVLMTEDGEREFSSREADVETVTRRAFDDRILVTVTVESSDRHVPVSLILRATPRRHER
jgi:hypothetical protein